jgi:DNA-binding PadR family transcriptional regulator
LGRLDRVVHAPARLGALTALLVEGPLDYTALRERLGVPDGSLHLHLGKLEKRRLVAAVETSGGRRPRTTYRLTAAGRKALSDYLAAVRHWEGAVAQFFPDPRRGTARRRRINARASEPPG